MAENQKKIEEQQKKMVNSAHISTQYSKSQTFVQKFNFP